MGQQRIDFARLIEDALASEQRQGEITNPSGTRTRYEKRLEPGVTLRLGLRR
ncbi:MAG: hypothetical protein JSV86_19525 [Gemmatimonadota bacterium]|nr:MAG: hypothetical protein JSV86_19525 [Gemmatimonadota bacterium]